MGLEHSARDTAGHALKGSPMRYLPQSLAILAPKADPTTLARIASALAGKA